MLAGFVLVLFLFGMALGVAAIAIVLRMGPAAEWFVWPIPALLSPFAAVYYPLSTLPRPMQWFSRLLPPSYVFEGMRAVVAGRRFDGRIAGGSLRALHRLSAAGLLDLCAGFPVRRHHRPDRAL